MRGAVAAVVLCLLLALPVAAGEETALYEEQLFSSGAQGLTEHLPKDAQTLLEQLSGELWDPTTYTDFGFQQAGDLLERLLSLQSETPLQVLGVLLGVVILSAMFSNLEGMAGSLSLRQTYHTVAVLAAGSGLLLPLFSLMEQVAQTVEQVAVFMTAFVPVYGGIIATGGGVTSAISYQTTLLAGAELLTWLIHGVVFPALTVSLALGCTGSVAGGFCLDSISAMLHKWILWALGLFSTLFSGLLSLQQMVAGAGDSLGGRVMRFSLASFVPVVGGLLSEAYSTVVGCSGLLRSTVGCFGLLATVLIVLPSLVACILWSVSLGLAGSGAALFGLTELQRLCKVAAGAVRVLIAVLAVFALLMVISLSVVVFAARGR